MKRPSQIPDQGSFHAYLAKNQGLTCVRAGNGTGGRNPTMICSLSDLETELSIEFDKSLVQVRRHTTTRNHRTTRMERRNAVESHSRRKARRSFNLVPEGVETFLVGRR